MPDLKEILKFGNSFCVLPFLHEHLDVDHKKKVCCLSNQEINNNRLTEIQNSMLNNEVVPECNACYDKENNRKTTTCRFTSNRGRQVENIS